MAWTGAILPLPVPHINLLLFRMMMEGSQSCETFKVHGVTNQTTVTLMVKAVRESDLI